MASEPGATLGSARTALKPIDCLRHLMSAQHRRRLDCQHLLVTHTLVTPSSDDLLQANEGSREDEQDICTDNVRPLVRHPRKGLLEEGTHVSTVNVSPLLPTSKTWSASLVPHNPTPLRTSGRPDSPSGTMLRQTFPYALLSRPICRSGPEPFTPWRAFVRWEPCR